MALALLLLRMDSTDMQIRDERPAEVRPTPVASQPEAAPEPDERHAVRTMVRRHRRTADDDWCNILADAIYDESLAAGVDPLLVASIVAVESSFQSQVVSKMGAVGLMQLRPFVAEPLAGRNNIEWIGIETLHEPRINIRLGISYYQELLSLFNDDLRVALTAYNFGPSRVTGWLRAGSYEGSEYATRVMNLYAAVQRD